MQPGFGFKVGGVIVAVIFIAALLVAGIKGTEATVTGRVLNAYVQFNKSGTQYMAVVQESDGSVETFQDSDSLFFAKYNSSDVYAQLLQDVAHKSTVTLHVFGWRNHLFSQYRNILSVSP